MLPVSVEETINTSLAEHQSSVPNWCHRDLAAELHQWASRMILPFKLEIGVPALLIEPLRGSGLGHYREGRNGFGLQDEIAIDERHTRQDPFWYVLATLLHELLHSWQRYHGRPGRGNYHNKEFRDKAAELGLIIDASGSETYPASSTPFTKLLQKHGVDAPQTLTPPEPPRRFGRSTLKLYECSCGVKVRVGRSRFRALCLDCNTEFEQKG